MRHVIHLERAHTVHLPRRLNDEGFAVEQEVAAVTLQNIHAQEVLGSWLGGVNQHGINARSGHWTHDQLREGHERIAGDGEDT